MPGTPDINLLNTALVFLQKEFCTVLRPNYSINDKLKLEFYKSKKFWGVFLAAFSILLVWISVRHKLLS